MTIAALSEVISISMVLPFLGVLVSPEKILSHELALPFIEALEINSSQDALLPLTLIFSLAVIFAGVTRTTLHWMQARLSMAIGADFSVQVYERTLYQPYSLHVSRNSSEILAGSQKARDLVGYIIQPSLAILSSTLILLAVLSTLIYIELIISITAFFGFALIYAGIVFITKRSVANNSEIIASQQIRVAKAVQEGLGGIRDVIIDGSQRTYTKLYRDAVVPMQLALASNQVVGVIPRFGVESFGMVLIAGLAYILAADSWTVGGQVSAIPVLGALALGAQRLLPVLQQIYNSWIIIRGNCNSAQDALYLLDQPLQADAIAHPSNKMVFQEAITLRDLGFRYSPQSPWVLRDLNLKIPRGSRVGFVGATGSGKSTLLDIVMGLLTPTEGGLIIDNTSINNQNTRSWQANISHVPQVVFLSDTSVAENIALGTPADKIDIERVKQAAQLAQLSQTIERLSSGYDTLVGERGVRLSGGQRQRIGIARALYKQANVIVLDEATSALDNETEAAVMQAVQTLSRDVTILLIAHRITTLANCDLIVELANGRIKPLGGYEKITRSIA